MQCTHLNRLVFTPYISQLSIPATLILSLLWSNQYTPHAHTHTRCLTGSCPLCRTLKNPEVCVYLMVKWIFVAGSRIVNGAVCLCAPIGSHSPQMEHWGLPTWASRMQAAIHASLGIDLACQVQLEGSSLLVSSPVKEQIACALHLVSRIYCIVWINTRELLYREDPGQ